MAARSTWGQIREGYAALQERVATEQGEESDPQNAELARQIEEACDYWAHRAGEHLEVQNIWQLLEEGAPAGCEAVQDLYSWSLNYDTGKGPFTLFADLIGWSEDELGEPLYDLHNPLGYLECDKLAHALAEYAERPGDVRTYIERLIAAGAES